MCSTTTAITVSVVSDATTDTFGFVTTGSTFGSGCLISTGSGFCSTFGAITTGASKSDAETYSSP